MAGFVDRLRSGSWLTRERARRVALAMLIAGLAGAVYVVVTANGLSDRFGRPLGTDFSSFYAAGTLVDDGLPAAPFDLATHYAREQKIFGNGTPDYSFSYPPTFLLVAAALALLNYLPALLLWQGATFGLYLWAMRAIFRGNEAARAESAGWMPLLLTAAFPAVFVNLGHGQNGFLTAGLFGMALAVLERRPVLAGILFGLLSYKPQFGFMIPLVLLATWRWRAIAAAAGTVGALIGTSLVAFGEASWQAFFAAMPFARSALLEQGNTGWFKIQSVFAWVRMWGGGIELAYAAQLALALVVGAALVWLWRGAAAYAVKAAALLIGSLLATPFILDYDLMLLAPAIAFIAADGMRRGFGAYEKSMLAALWIAPLIARSAAQTILLPLGVLAMLAAFALLLRRAIAERAPRPHGILDSAA